MKLIRLRIFFSLFLCAAIFSSSARAADTATPRLAFHVILANDPRLPAASPAVVEEALKIATNWIEVWYLKRVRFEIVGRVDIDSYIAGHFETLPILNDWKKFPYALNGTDSIARFISMQTTALQQESMDTLRSYVPAAVRSAITTPASAAVNLLSLYDEKLRIWKNLKSPKGVHYLDSARPEKHSFWYWERVFDTLKPEEIKDHLIVTNVMLLDDALADAPPHSLIRGGLLNGLAQEECPQAIVSTFPILTDAPALAELRDTTDFSSKDRLMALAHIIAHEFGAHVIQGYRDAYDHDACLTVPTSGLAYVSTLRRLVNGTPCRKEHRMLDRRTALADRYQSLAYRNLEIKNYVQALEMVERAIRIDPKRVTLNQLRRQISRMMDSSKKNGLQ